MQVRLKQQTGSTFIQLDCIQSSRYWIRSSHEEIDTLRNSIEQFGLLNPIIVRPKGSNNFEVITGHRRLEACRQLRWYEIPATIRVANDKEAYLLSLAENLERETLDAVEEGEAFKRFVLEYGWGSVSELARRICRSEEYVSQKIQILSLPPEVLDKVKRGSITQSHAEELVWIRNSKFQRTLSDIIMRNHLTVSQTHELAKRMKHVTTTEDVTSVLESLTPEFDKIDSVGKENNVKALKKAIAALRTSLSVLDIILDDTQGSDMEMQPVRNRLHVARYGLHQIIDGLIKEKVHLGKKQSKWPR